MMDANDIEQAFKRIPLWVKILWAGHVAISSIVVILVGIVLLKVLGVV